MSSTSPPRTAAERATYLREEMDTVLHVATRNPARAIRHASMPEVRLMAVRTMDRAATAPVVELQVEAFIGGILEIMQLCLERNHLQGTDLADVYRICETALARIIDAAD